MARWPNPGPSEDFRAVPKRSCAGKERKTMKDRESEYLAAAVVLRAELSKVQEKAGPNALPENVEAACRMYDRVVQEGRSFRGAHAMFLLETGRREETEA